jgi:carboxypeptidase PM20D1
MPGLAKPAALIGVAEKGFLSIKLTTTGTPGHSSMPPPPGEGAIGILAAALARLDATPVPGGLRGVAAQMFDAIGPEMQGVNRYVLTNLWLTRPWVERMLAKAPSTNAMIRTTTALTIVNGGNKENVLPGQAEAIVNFRLLPGDTADRIVDFVRATVADERVQIQPMPSRSEPSRVSSTDSDAYRLVERTVRELFPQVLVAPGLMIGATDARHFEAIADQVLRFSPVWATSEDLKRFHGTDERLSIDNLVDLIRFYHRLVQQAAQ